MTEPATKNWGEIPAFPRLSSQNVQHHLAPAQDHKVSQWRGDGEEEEAAGRWQTLAWAAEVAAKQGFR